jgi:hypothetical protein
VISTRPSKSSTTSSHRFSARSAASARSRAARGSSSPGSRRASSSHPATSSSAGLVSASTARQPSRSAVSAGLEPVPPRGAADDRDAQLGAERLGLEAGRVREEEVRAAARLGEHPRDEREVGVAGREAHEHERTPPRELAQGRQHARRREARAVVGRAEAERVGRRRRAAELEHEAPGVRRERGRVRRRERRHRGLFVRSSVARGRRPEPVEASRDHGAPGDRRHGGHEVGRDRGPRVGILQDLEHRLARDALAQISEDAGQRGPAPSRVVEERLDLALARLVVEPPREPLAELLPRGRARELGTAQPRDQDGLANLEAL